MEQPNTFQIVSYPPPPLSLFTFYASTGVLPRGVPVLQTGVPPAVPADKILNHFMHQEYTASLTAALRTARKHDSNSFMASHVTPPPPLIRAWCQMQTLRPRVLPTVHVREDDSEGSGTPRYPGKSLPSDLGVCREKPLEVFGTFRFPQAICGSRTSGRAPAKTRAWPQQIGLLLSVDCPSHFNWLRRWADRSVVR